MATNLERMRWDDAQTLAVLHARSASSKSSRCLTPTATSQVGIQGLRFEARPDDYPLDSLWPVDSSTGGADVGCLAQQHWRMARLSVESVAHRSRSNLNLDLGGVMVPNELEVALELATRDPGHRPSFYRQLLASEIVVLLGPADDGLSRDGTGMMVWTRIDGIKVIPFFSSLAVYQQQPNAKAQPVIIPARRLLEAAQIHSMHLHLNPHREFGREFALEELASLLADGTIHSGTTQTVVDAPMQVIFRTPQDEIDGFRTGLVSLLMSSQQVRAAYLFEMERLSPSAETSLIVGIAGPHEESLLTSISTVVADTYTGRLPVDVMFLTSNDQVASLQRAAIPPIFKRSWQEPSRSPQAGLQ